MSIHDETEADTRAERIDPVLAAAGWGGDRLQMYEHADGRWAIAWRIACSTGE